ncbi:prenyltransferase/squalene oxidase repeat-containing protein [Streptacidiphilus melanogenes]|uniref:prenyltransferase/squalene oxidase repeat-containing protein n=1 Tax=Streptacidiphilus melanogenes TaxID=411235 RepID=UPI0006940945|nr:prenyltransferase/squalene oxidase repeat-containing protein [Streptacidiphilus melanogenes]
MTATTPIDAPGERLLTSDGGARQGGADLWCTYAAIRTLTWLDAEPLDRAAAVAQLTGCQNSDGGFAWQKGLPSDVWATYYCTQAMRDLGVAPDRLDELTRWLTGLQHADGGFAMTPGQAPDVWATYYATRTFSEVLALPVPRVGDVHRWLSRLQRADGGLGWYPGARASDTRACYYGAMAWRASLTDPDEPAPWRVAELESWLLGRRQSDAGFVFDDSADRSCLWATFRAVRALDALAIPQPRAEECLAWITGRLLPGTGFARWNDYEVADVWACFSAVGALQTLGGDLSPKDRAQVVDFLHGCELPDGGFTYRRVDHAGDSLATSAALITESLAGRGDEGRAGELADWLHRAHMPYEGGVMYMPGRGAEVRCTLWATSATSAAGARPLDRDRLADWLGRLQNPDGGHGYWHGRASDMVATVSALETLHQLGHSLDEVLDTTATELFLTSCADGADYRYTPSGQVTAGSTAQAARALWLLGRREEANKTAARLVAFSSRIGGSSAQTRGLPDLATTYQVVLTRQTLGVAQDPEDTARFLGRVRLAGGYAWSPLGQRSGGPLADCLGFVLDRYAASGGRIRLPSLNL